MLISRRLEPHLQKSKKSILLIGPRQTGKSTLIQQLDPDLSVNLMHEPTYLEFSRNPDELDERLNAGVSGIKTVLIDEVQRVPSILNTVQVLLDNHPGRWKFFLTGSSARRLRRGHANLLPGRVHAYTMSPLVSGELEYAMDTRRALETGTLPALYLEKSVDERMQTLRSYAGTYLREEVQAEALARDIQGFSRFLNVTAASFASYTDFVKLSKEASVPRQTAVRYFEILEDTLIVLRCSAFAKSARRRLIQHPKYYFFDNGVLNALLKNFTASPDRIGPLFENLFFSQLHHGAWSADRDVRISSFRTSHGLEVDFIVESAGNVWAVEVKGSSTVHEAQLSGLKGFREFYGKKCETLVAYLGNVKREIAGVRVLPWQTALREMGF